MLVKDAWAEAYAKPNKDPHSVFANLMGITRQEAKTLAFQYMYSYNNPWIIERYMDCMKETRFVYHALAGRLKALGAEVPELQELFNEMD